MQLLSIAHTAVVSRQRKFHRNTLGVPAYVLPDTKVGPAQACGLICVGDVLVGVGDDRVKGMRFPNILGELPAECNKEMLPWKGRVSISIEDYRGTIVMQRSIDSDLSTT